jgi:gliding motility-associated-like protein
VDLTQYLATILTGQPDTDFSVSFHLTQNDAQNDVNAIANTSGYIASTGTLWIRVENKLTGCARLVPFNFLIERLPEPAIVTDTNSNVICVDFISGQVVRPLTLEVDNDVPGSYTYAWYLSPDLVNAIASGPSYTVDTAHPDGNTRTYVVVMTSTSALGCSQASASFDVIQSGQAVVPAGQIGYTVSNAFSDLQTITVTVDGYGMYQYSLDDGPRQDSPVFTDVPMGEHTITVWDTEGGLANSCDPLILTGVSIIDYPHYFTPNGDGINETWNIVGLQNQPAAKIYIFDRYGKLLKQISPTAAGWDGTYNGALMPATDYWFLVEYFEGDIAKEFKSHFSLKR